MLNRNIAKRERPLRPRNITGNRIKEIRLACKPKVSQEDLSGRLAAQGLTLTRTQVAKIEGGHRPVMDYELLAIAKALRVPVEKLFASRVPR